MERLLFDAYGLLRAMHSRFYAPLWSVLDMCHWHLKSSISTIKVFDPDTTISYGRTFRTTDKTRIGVLPIGYADGFFRGLSNRMAVQTADGLGTAAGPDLDGDGGMVDLTALPEVKVGDTVEIFWWTPERGLSGGHSGRSPTS